VKARPLEKTRPRGSGLVPDAAPFEIHLVKSRWVYRKLRNFRAGIEAGISCLKRAYGLARCTWRGLNHFRAYVWSSVVAYNLTLLGRLKPS
jgi:IS5 family transposase